MKKLLRDIALGLYSGGGLPAISVSPSSWDFGSTPVGSPVTKEFAIENTGTVALEITLPITIVGDDADAFSVTDQPDETSLAPGESTTFTAQADADVVDVFDANISITNNSSENPKLVAVTVDVSAMLYSDEFTGTVAAPIPAGNADTRGYRVVNDVENKMSIGSGVLTVLAQTSAVMGEEQYLAQPSSGQAYWTRPTGKALVMVTTANFSTRSLQLAGWWSSAVLDLATSAANFLAGSTDAQAYVGTTVSDAQAYGASVDIPLAVAWTSTGFYVYVKLGGIWHFKWFKPQVLTQSYCGISNFNSVSTAKYFRIYAVDESLFAPALSVVAPSVGNLTSLPDGDFLMYLDSITLPSAASIVLRVKKKDANNNWLDAISSGGTLTINENIAGSQTNRIAGAGVITTDDIVTIRRAAVVQAWEVNAAGTPAAIGSAYTSAYTFLREVGLELNSLGVNGAIGALYAWKARLLDEGALGAELVVNGDFATDTVWIKGTGWTISGGAAHKTAGTLSDLFQDLTGIITAGKYYEVVFTVSNYVAGTVSVVIGSNAILAPISANGTYTLRGVCVGSPNLYFKGDAAFVGSIDNASCKEITFTADSLALVLDGLAA